MLSYLKFFLAPVYLCMMILSLLVGGLEGVLIAFLIVVSIVLGEFLLGDDTSTPNYKYPFLLDFSLFMNVPLYFIVLYLYLDKIANAFEWYYLLYIPILGLQMALSLINTGHELVHRTSKKFDCEVGNWALATAWNPAFAVEHVYGHHKNIGVADVDPVTASYGENPYLFTVKAFFGEHIHSWGIETRQLKRRKQPIFSWHNRIINGHIRTMMVFGFIGYFFGWQAMLAYIALGCVANYIFQLNNFVEHYGLVRIKGTPVQYHHSWNSNNRMTSYLTYNLTRHSDHHVNAKKEFWELDPCENEGVTLRYGYLTYFVLFTFLPGYARSRMEPRLKNWHQNYASDDEKSLTTHYLNFSN